MEVNACTGRANLIISGRSLPAAGRSRESSMTVRVVAGEIDSKDVTTRVVLPTTALPRWLPFQRATETIATPRRPFPPHRHEGVEVFTYVIEGSATYTYGSSSADPLESGSTKLLTAPTSASHAISPRKGRTVRWFSLVVALPDGRASAPGLQSSRAVTTDMQPDGTVLEELVGPRSALKSAAGLECEGIVFVQAGTVFRRVGHDRRAVVYALTGPGTIDYDPLDAGEAAFIENSAGVALQGDAGFRVILCSAPRTGPA